MENNTEEHMSYALLTIDTEDFMKKFDVNAFREYMKKEVKYDSKDESFRKSFDVLMELLQVIYNEAKREEDGSINSNEAREFLNKTLKEYSEKLQIAK